MWPGHVSGMWPMWLGWLLGLAVLALIVWAAARGVRSTARDSGSPELILKRRYARGEMDEQEYQRRLNELRK